MGISVLSNLIPFSFCTISRASLVPVFAFGENDLFDQVSNPRGSWLRDIQLKIQRKVAFAPVLFHGRGIFQYTFGFLPHRKPVNVVGKSMDIPRRIIVIIINIYVFIT